MQDIRALAQQFSPYGDCGEPELFGDGHINDTYRFTTVDDHGAPVKLVLQRINRAAFPRPDQVMSNMLRVTSYLRQRIAEEGRDPLRETIALVSTIEGRWFVLDEMGDVWRAYRFVDDAISYNQTTDPHVFRMAGEAFGQFQRMLGSFDASALYETIPNFHHTPKRIEALLRAVQEDRAGRAAEVQQELQFVLAHEAFSHVLVDAQARGELPLRVTHNDTKLNNVLIDAKTGRGLCVIDLDTVMPGLSAYDFGDAIRFGANTAVEDEPDLELVRLSLPMYRAYAEGYLDAVGDTLTEAELRSLPDGARMMTLECGVRFLTDYLNGDVYFRVAYPKHNLVRARSQLTLLRDMDERFSQMQAIVAER